MASTDGRFSRLALDRVLGSGLFRITDSSVEGQRRDVIFSCGCLAREHEADRFEIFACPQHRDTFQAERSGRSVETPAT